MRPAGLEAKTVLETTGGDKEHWFGTPAGRRLANGWPEQLPQAA